MFRCLTLTTEKNSRIAKVRCGSADVGVYGQSGGKVDGWLVRALKGNQIVGVAASAPSLEETAANPERLNEIVAASPESASLMSTGQ